MPIMCSFFRGISFVLVIAISTPLARAWSPGVGSESATSGFSVDTQSRNDVISFWNCVYNESEGYESRINWTGSIGSGNAGTTSAAFKGDIERRINFYRAMAGMSANVQISSSSLATVNGGGTNAPTGTTQENAAQAAAFMVSCNSDEYRPGGGIATGTDSPHDPPASWVCDTSTARNGSHYSNLASGLYGPGAIDVYMSEDVSGGGSANNDDVGHRRHILYSRRQEFATGDVIETPSGNTPYYAANALYVSGNLLPAPTNPDFIAWPSAGFFPEPLLAERWSLSYPSADFSVAVVTVTNSVGGAVATNVVSRTANYGDKAIVWKFNTAPASAELADQTYNVTVSNIMIGGSPQSHSYSVTIINPNRLLETSELFGSASPPVTGANYFFDPVEQASEYELEISQTSPYTYVEGGETPAGDDLINGTALDNNTFFSTSFAYTGARCVRLAFASVGETFSSAEINNTLIPSTGSKVSFRTRRGYMVSSTTLALQASRDGGVSWTDLFTTSGNSDNNGGAPTDSNYSLQTVDIPSEFHSLPVTFRFVFRKSATSGSYVASQHALVGLRLDQISFSFTESQDVFTPTTIYSSLPVSNVRVDASTAHTNLIVGETYTLRLRAKVGCTWFSNGPALNITPVSSASLTAYENWLRGTYAIIGNYDDDYDNDGVPNGIEYLFGLNPTDCADVVSALTPMVSGGNLKLSHSIIPGVSISAEYSSTLLPGSWNAATVTISAGVATASVPADGPKKFIRWKTSQP